MQKRLTLALLVAGLAACSPADDPSVGAEAAAATPACATGSPLPLTGLCSDGAAALFLATDTSAQTVAPRCVWRTEEISLSPDEAIVFRAQDCAGEGWDQMVYSHASGYLKARLASVPEDQFGFILEIIPLAAGETAEQAALKTLDKAPGEQRARCEIHPLKGPKVVGRVFELAPNAELEAEMTAAHPDEPWDACGPNGFTGDAVQFWEGRDRHALFHMLGQDTPLWDPASFTFYRKGADGVWVKTS